MADKPLDRSARQQVTAEVSRAHPMMLKAIPVPDFYKLAAAVEDSCDLDRNRALVEEFLGNLALTRTKITDGAALERLPSMAFGGAYRRDDKFLTSASEALKQLSSMEVQLLVAHLQFCAEPLRQRTELVERFRTAIA